MEPQNLKQSIPECNFTMTVHKCQLVPKKCVKTNETVVENIVQRNGKVLLCESFKKNEDFNELVRDNIAN